MSISPQELEQLESFLDGTLSKDGAEELEHKLEKDPEFLAEAQTYLRLIRNLQQADPDRQRANRLVKSASFSTTGSRVRGLQPLLLLVATIALLVVAVIWINKNPKTRPQNVSADVDYGLSISATSLSSESIPLAEMEFKKGHYTKAAELFEQAYQKQPEDKLLLYNYAVACFKSENYLEAINGFNEVAKSDSNLDEDAQFYLAYSYFKKNQIDDSKRVLDSIVQVEGHVNLKDAKDLLEKIKKIKK
jgi:tetratricopeptide (TPR) repeat protein